MGGSRRTGPTTTPLSWPTEQSQKDTRSGADTNVRQMADPTSAVSYQHGARSSVVCCRQNVDEVAAVPGAEGVLTFDDFLSPAWRLGERIQPPDAVSRPHSCHHQEVVSTTLNARPEAITFRHSRAR